MAESFPNYAALLAIANYKHVAVDGTVVKASEEYVTNPRCRFELEKAKTGTSLFHIRSCYNNKYWVKEAPDSLFIKAGAAEPNEDPSSWSCTLVKVEETNTTATFQLFQTKKYIAVRLVHTEAAYQYSLYELGHHTNRETGFFMRDAQSYLTLPRSVVFKAEDSGKYLAVRTIDGQPHLRLDSDDLSDPRAAYETVPTAYGAVLIKSKYLNKFWRRDPSSDWVLVDSDEDKSCSNLKFYPAKANANNFTLRNAYRNGFCRSYTEDPRKVNCLRADTYSIIPKARLIVEEPVLSRELYNFNYRLQDARIYDQSILTMVNRVHENYGSQPETTQLRLKYSETSSRTFDRSISVSVTVATSVKAGIPFIAEGKIDVSATVEGSFAWSDRTEVSEEREVTETVIVPPKTRVKTSVVATQGRCDVPFSYTVRDRLATYGHVVTYTMDDGVFKGVNSYNFKFVTMEEPLSSFKGANTHNSKCVTKEVPLSLK